MPIEIPTTREGILALYEEVKPELQAFLADRAAGRDVEEMVEVREESAIEKWDRNSLKSKVAALNYALVDYSGADKTEIESKPVHGANLGGMFFRLARGATKYIPVVGGVVRSVDGFSSDSLKEVLRLYNHEVLHDKLFDEIQAQVSTVSNSKSVDPRALDEVIVSAAGSASSVSPDLHESASVSPKISQDEAATRIQAVYRGYNARNHFEPPVKAVASGAGEPEAVFVPAAVKKTRQYNEIKALQTQFNTAAKTKNHKLLGPTVDLLVKADPANTPKFIQSCIDKKLGGEDFNKHLTEELHHAKAKISAMQDRAKMDARAKKSMER